MQSILNDRNNPTKQVCVWDNVVEHSTVKGPNELVIKIISHNYTQKGHLSKAILFQLHSTVCLEL